MALPLLMLGAALSAVVMQELADDRTDKLRKRKRHCKVETLTNLAKYDSPVATYPSDFLTSISNDTILSVEPIVGAIVCCGLGGVLDHSGIYIGENTIIELSGSGLVKAVSMERFLAERSGKQIFIACDSKAQPLVNRCAVQQATKQIFNYYEYDVIRNNCHRFIWKCFNEQAESLSTFKTLSHKMARYYNRVIYWDVCKV